MRTSALLILLAFAWPPASLSAGDAAARGLSIILTDVEGGAATLIVTPAGESVLIDAGFPGQRDSSRIARTAKEAGVARIDHFITTHWHIDHVGGLMDLAKLIPVDRFYDHGLPAPLNDGGTDPKLIKAYEELVKGGAKTLHAGDEIPLKQVDGAPRVSLKCLVSNGLPEGGAAAAGGSVACKEHAAHPADLSDNGRSLGFILRFGEFKFLDLGDLTWNGEHALVCPKDRIGKVDVYQVTHHGNDSSNNPLVLQAASPQVAVMPNGPHKGGAKSVHALLAAQKIETFQLHKNVDTKDSDNAPPDHIANLAEKCEGEPVSIRVSPDAKGYSVKVGRSGLEKTYSTK